MGQGSQIEVRTGAIFAVALALLILPLSFFVSFLMAAVIHELCHYLVLRWAGVRVYRITIDTLGASMETEAMEPHWEAFCALAGPVGSFLLAACHGIFPEIALCGLIQGCFNLLPVYPMDGGRVLMGMLEMMSVSGKERICLWIGRMTGCCMGCLCLYGFMMWNLGWGILILGTVLVHRTFPRKTPCKEGFFAVQ